MLIRIATRESQLALWQAKHVKQLLENLSADINCELVPMSTQGDRNTRQALTDIGGKNLFTKEIQHAVLDGRADIAVHCVKDLSVNERPDLSLACVLERADPRDVLISAVPLSELKQGAIIGTASPRRRMQLHRYRQDFNCTLLRGNVNTRLAKYQAGEYDAIILAAAGLQRLGLDNVITEYLNTEQFVPAIGQGALAIECRSDDENLKQLLQPLNDSRTAACVTAERAVNQVLGGDCHTPLGAYATLDNDQLHLHAMLGDEQANRVLEHKDSGNVTQAQQLGERVAKQLLERGADALLHHD